jgi:inward rectifier potassium channel
MTVKSTREEQARLLQRNGRFNIVRRGVPERRMQDLYARLLSATWGWLITILVTGYLAINALFALAYLALGNAIENARPGSFEDAFFFSVQTMATIGYGKLIPIGTVANTLVTAEALIGLGGLAVATGLLFAKFSRPTARVVFSRHAVVTLRDRVPRLMFRVANERESLIVEAQMRVVLVREERTAEGETMRRFHDLELERGRTPIFPLSWTVSHVLDAKSPLAGLSSETLAARKVELVCSLTGTEELFASTIHARYSYSADDIKVGHRFVDIISVEPDGRRAVDYAHFHEIEPDHMPRREAAPPDLSR